MSLPLWSKVPRWLVSFDVSGLHATDNPYNEDELVSMLDGSDADWDRALDGLAREMCLSREEAEKVPRQRYGLTSHAFARRNPDEIMWITPVCDNCFGEVEWCFAHEGGLPDCPECERKPIPYRKFYLPSEIEAGLTPKPEGWNG